MKIERLFMLSILVFVILGSYLFSDVKNPDKPLKGEWDFKLKKLWEIDHAGEEVLAYPTHLLVSGEGTIYLYDKKNFKYYLFSNDGKFVKTFGPTGEGPGEIKRFYDAFLTNNKLIVADLDNLHYFDKNGNYIKSVKCVWSQKQPSFFFNEDEFIHFPQMVNSADSIADISHFNLKTGKAKSLAKFKMFMGGFATNEEGRGRNRGRVIVKIPGISPFIVAGYDSDRFYYGFNSSYNIAVVDYEGKKLFNFSLERKKKKLTKKEKRDFFDKNPPPQVIPEKVLEEIIKTLPDELTYFSRIEVHHKLIYFHVSYLNRQPKRQQIDIFSPEGKYLYRAFINAPGGFNIVSGPLPVLAIKNDHLYIALEDEKSNITLARYSITLPSL